MSCPSDDTSHGIYGNTDSDVHQIRSLSEVDTLAQRRGLYLCVRKRSVTNYRAFKSSSVNILNEMQEENRGHFDSKLGCSSMPKIEGRGRWRGFQIALTIKSNSLRELKDTQDETMKVQVKGERHRCLKLEFSKSESLFKMIGENPTKKNS